ncbi:MAG: hypothetical protein JMJ96_09510 [Desulfovibrio alaskensis]|jgi:hypothetical protein|nr:hypothetical protein [Oleidesulfovibrio alaskensis]
MPRDRIVRLDSDHAEEAMRALGKEIAAIPASLNKAVVRALNTTVRAMRDEASTAIRRKYAARARDVKATMWVSKAKPHYKVAILKARGRMSIPLIGWGAKQVKKGVTVKIMQGQPRKRVSKLKGKALPGVFIAKGDVYARLKATRYPVVKLYGPSFLAELTSPETRYELQVRAERVLRVRLQHEMEFLHLREKT